MNEIQNKNTRIQSIDALRGFVMILMALDHTRDYFTNYAFSPSDLDKTNLFLFFTRFITHFCAPAFVFLVGTSMALALASGKSKKELSFFLFTRGLWLIVAELTIMHFAWTFSLDFTTISISILSITGLSMIALGAFIFLPKKITLILGLIVLFGHNLIDNIETQLLGSFDILHKFRPFTFDLFQSTYRVLPWYSLIPWIIIPALGFVFGSLYTIESHIRKKYLWKLGSLSILGFLILRFINVYGDPAAWICYTDSVKCILSFFNTSKYPPSLQFFLMTLGPVFLILALLESRSGSIVRTLKVFGKVPFMYYVAHIFLIHFIAVAISYMRFGHAQVFMNENLLYFDPTVLAPYGYNLGIVYLIWILVVAILYPLCVWYGNIKQKYKNSVLLSYL